MSRRAKTVAELSAQLANAHVRTFDNDFRERMRARTEVERLEKALIRAERREQQDGELS